MKVCALLFYACNFCITYNLISTMNHHSKSKDKKFLFASSHWNREYNLFKYNKMFNYTILLYSLTGKNECVLCRKPYMSKHPLRHQHTIQGRENYQMSSMTNKNVRKDVLTSHQRVHTSELVLSRKQNAFETHLTQC